MIIGTILLTFVIPVMFKGVKAKGFDFPIDLPFDRVCEVLINPLKERCIL